MKPLLINAFDIKGGAAIATHRLHLALRSIGVDSHMRVQYKHSGEQFVIGPETKVEKALALARPQLEALATKLYSGKPNAIYSPAILPNRSLASEANRLGADIAHLFWINAAFMRIEAIADIKQPIVWTLHDMWPFTGGCHYDDACGKFRDACGACPVLQSDQENDLSRRVWQRKQRSWDKLPMTIVATSHWLADMARESSVFGSKRIEVLPNPIDTERYKPIDKRVAREAWGLPQDKKLMLFSAFRATADKRKGNQFLLPALEQLARSSWGKDAELLVIGAHAPAEDIDLGMKIHYMGYLNDEISQVLLYSAADVTVAPSMQENLSNTVMESLACGTPVVAFDIGGMPDLIDHEKSGYLARPFEPKDLAHGIVWVLEDETRHAMLRRHARKKVEASYAMDTVARQYRELYQDILA